MARALLCSVWILLGIASLIGLANHLIKRIPLTKTNICSIVLGLAAMAIGIWWLLPFSVDLSDQMVVEQSVSWHGVADESTQPECVQLEYLPADLKVHRYRFGDVPMPGEPFGTRSVHIDLTLENETCTLILTPDRPESSMIHLYDRTRIGNPLYLNKECAQQWIDILLTKQ